jgi:hydrogenase maturation protease
MKDCSILMLGVGNILWADEGFGVRVIETLHQQYLFPDTVQLMDGGTQGLYLLPYVQAARQLLLFDAIDYDLPPGSLKVIYNDEVPAFLNANKMSPHQMGFQEVLASARLLEQYPEDIVLIGVQPQLLDDYGGDLTDAVKQQIQPAIHIALEHLSRWGIQVQPRI